MLKSIMRASLRNIIRNKSFSFINLVGLSVSMSLCLLIILIVREQFSFDNFHAEREKIFQVNAAMLTDHGTAGYNVASVPMPVAAVLRDEFTFADDVVAVNKWVVEHASSGKTTIPLSGLFVDDSFFDVFHFPLAYGNAPSLLNAKSVILTDETAKKLFGKADATGKPVSLGSYGDYIVAGVLEPINNNTHFEFEALLSTAAITSLEKTGAITPVSENWSQYYGSYVYVKLKDNDSNKADKSLAALSAKYGKNLKLDAGLTGFDFFLLPLSEVTPGPASTFNQMGHGVPITVLMFLGALAAVVMVMSILNFTNLMIAKSLTRAREIGVRKIVGAKRGEIFSQFIGESMVFALVALLFSYLLLQALKVGISTLWLSGNFSLHLLEDVFAIGLFVAYAFFVGLFAGLLPATYLSAFRPLQVLKDAGNVRINSKLTFRKILVVTQFTFSVMFVIVVLVINRQMSFMINADYGFNKENVINVRLQGVGFEKIAQEARMISAVRGVGGISTVPGTFSGSVGDYKATDDAQAIPVSQFLVDDQYLANLGVSFLAGQNFDPAKEGGNEMHVILNEEAVAIFNLGNAHDAIGENLILNDSVSLKVIGVVKNFHFRPLSEKIGPLAIRYNPSQLSIMSLWIEPSEKKAVLSAVAKIWKKVDDNALSYRTMEEDLEGAYDESGLSDMVAVTAYITILAVTLACLGMLGMAMYAVQTRVKEVGIRMVIGATLQDVVLLLSKSFMKLIVIAVIIGTPVSYFIGEAFLSTFAFRIQVGVSLITGGVSIIVLLGLLVVGSQALKAAITNPVKSLRYE